MNQIKIFRIAHIALWCVLGLVSANHTNRYPLRPIGSCTEHGIYTVDSSDSEHYYHCWNGEKREFYCKTGEKFTIPASGCVKATTERYQNKHPLKPIGSCTEHGVYSVDSSDSEHYYHCWNGEKREFYCKVGEKFSIPASSCVKATTGSYQNKHPLKPIGSCTEHGVYSVDSSDSEHYYHCWNGEKREFYCKTGEKFSIPASGCVKATTERYQNKHPLKPIGSCTEHGVYSVDSSDSEHYYHCWNGEKREFYCKTGEKFSIPASSCVTATTGSYQNKHPLKPIGSCTEHGVYSVDSSDSEHYYHCWNGEKREFYCKAGEKFSVPASSCVRAHA